MSARKFIETAERSGGAYRKVARITCCKCGVSTSQNIETKSGLLVSKQISTRFERAGWTIGRNADNDVCPGCSNKKQEVTAVSGREKPQQQSPSETPPREMGRDDRRIVFAKLNEVYIDPRRGYASGWSDNKVATDLGVPRKWVESVRSEMFGDNRSNEDNELFVNGLQQLCRDLDTMEALFKDILVDQATLRELGETIAKIRERQLQLEKNAAPLIKLYVEG